MDPVVRGVLPFSVTACHTAGRICSGTVGDAKVQDVASSISWSVALVESDRDKGPGIIYTLEMVSTRPNNKSRMNREIHVRFRESLRVESPGLLDQVYRFTGLRQSV